jgi:hypothetical protein
MFYLILIAWMCFDNIIKVDHNLNAKIEDNIERILNWILEIFFIDDLSVVAMLYRLLLG